jgi:hypothetical protein
MLPDTSLEVLKLLLDFIYAGQVMVASAQMQEFMDLAELLQVRGLHAAKRPIIATNGPTSSKKRRYAAASTRHEESLLDCVPDSNCSPDVKMEVKGENVNEISTSADGGEEEEPEEIDWVSDPQFSLLNLVHY